MVRCKKCIYFDPFKAEGGYINDLGHCRKNSPVRLPYTPFNWENWPIVNINDWCGEGIEQSEYILHNMVQKKIYAKRLVELLKDQHETLKLINSDLIAKKYKNYWDNIKLRLEEMIEIIENALKI